MQAGGRTEVGIDPHLKKAVINRDTFYVLMQTNQKQTYSNKTNQKQTYSNKTNQKQTYSNKTKTMITNPKAEVVRN
jgi:hypothetical protein